MARFIQINAAGEIVGNREAREAPPNTDDVSFVRYTHSEDNERWGNFWPESRRNGLWWPNGSARYIYDSALRAPVLQTDTTNYIRVNPTERSAAKGLVSVVRFVWLGTTGSKVDGYQGVHYAALEKAGESIPVRLIFDDGVAVLRETLEPGWYEVRRARDPEDATNFPALIGDLDFAVYVNAGDPALLGV